MQKNGFHSRVIRCARGALAGAVLAIAVLPLIAQAADSLPSWTDGASKARIVSFVEGVTDPTSKAYVPPAERIAVFDNDGTLWSEQPMYFQLAFILDRVKALAPQHPEWQTQEPFKSVLAGDMAGVAATGEHGLLELMAATHAGMTSEEFAGTVSNWLETARHPRFERPYTDLTYAPMTELLAYLRANGFKTFIVSGGGVEFVRVFSERVYGVPPEQVVGSSIRTKYEVRDGKPAIVRLPEMEFIDDKAGKPVGINRYIGRRPILAFGNSDGDFEMLEYTTSGTGPRLGVLVHHDDGEREYAYDRKSSIGRLDRGLDESAKRGWVVVSMKSDWRAVYADSPR
jgi:phosphoglycolate phosphatase-like HAD superfamily hydrolase